MKTLLMLPKHLRFYTKIDALIFNCMSKKNADTYFGVVTDKKVANYFKTQKVIDRTPSVLLVIFTFFNYKIHVHRFPRRI